MKNTILKWLAIIGLPTVFIIIVAYFNIQNEKKLEQLEIEEEMQEATEEMLAEIERDVAASKAEYANGDKSEAISMMNDAANYAYYLQNEKHHENDLLTETLTYYNDIVHEYFKEGTGKEIYEQGANSLTFEQIDSFYGAYILLREEALEDELARYVMELEGFYNQIEAKRDAYWDNQKDANKREDSRSPYTEDELRNDPNAPSTNPNDYNEDGEYVPHNGVSESPEDYSVNGEYKPVDEMTDEEIIEELNSFFGGE